jgi:hypothetical protein
MVAAWRMVAREGEQDRSLPHQPADYPPGGGVGLGELAALGVRHEFLPGASREAGIEAVCRTHDYRNRDMVDRCVAGWCLLG